MTGAVGRLPDAAASEFAGEMRRRQFATLLEHSPYATVVLDADGRICEWNLAVELLLGLPRPEVIGVPARHLVPPQINADHGTQFTSWAFTERIRASGLMPSFGSVGDGLDNAMMESFWSSMQIELLNRSKWRTRLELANAMFEYIEIFHNRQRRHSQLGYLSPIEYELTSTAPLIPA